MRFLEFYNRREIQHAANLLAKVLSLPRHPDFGTVKESKAHESTEKYWTNTHSPLFYWLKQHGIEASPGNIPQFVQGGAGRVYFVGKYAIKFSNNRVEANVAKMVQGRTDLPTAVIDVKTLDNNTYAILQPHVDTNIPEEIQKASDYLTDIIDEHPEMTSFPSDKASQDKLCRATLKKFGGDISLIAPMQHLMDMLNKLYQATGFKHDDATPTNLGNYQGRTVITDLGPNEPGNFNPSSALDRISQNRSSLGLPVHSNI